MPRLKGSHVKIGGQLYLPTSAYLSHGVDDFHGGLAVVNKINKGISGGKPTLFVGFVEHPGHSYNLPILLEEQTELRERFGTQRAYPDPDYREEFNKDD